MVRHEILTANKKRKLDHGAQTTTTNAKAVVEREKRIGDFSLQLSCRILREALTSLTHFESSIAEYYSYR
jgi:hypothetical protein